MVSVGAIRVRPWAQPLDSNPQDPPPPPAPAPPTHAPCIDHQVVKGSCRNPDCCKKGKNLCDAFTYAEMEPPTLGCVDFFVGWLVGLVWFGWLVGCRVVCGWLMGGWMVGMIGWFGAC